MKLARSLTLVLLCAVASSSAQAPVAAARIVQINLDDVVHPVSADYIKDGLNHAKDINARAVVLRLDTPGGLIDSMRDIVEAILASPVPVITWVGPVGSRAASAGFFILLAGDVAVMAPGTNSGAAHPVTATGQKIEDVMEKEVVSDASAYIRSYTAKRGRNAQRSEEHTSELQSRLHLVCRLLLEKKKTKLRKDHPVAHFNGLLALVSLISSSTNITLEIASGGGDDPSDYIAMGNSSGNTASRLSI